MDHTKNTTRTDNSEKKEPSKMINKMDFGNTTTKTENSTIKNAIIKDNGQLEYEETYKDGESVE